jgi:ubiquinone/menaquinone biosynthesis C-methylase UbiE
VDDLTRFLPDNYSCSTILDIGNGRGHSLKILDDRFKPDYICGIEIDATLVTEARKRAESCHSKVELIVGNAEELPYADNSFDMVFCHQSIHHIVKQEKALAEFYRVLKPNGILLFAESCRKFIHSFLIRLLFRHPMEVQKTSDEYVELIRKTGFQVQPNNISTPYLWWSRNDIGTLEWLGFEVPAVREETLLNLVANKC